MTSLHVVAVQTGPAASDVEGNVSAALSPLRGIHPDVVLFPELFSRPFWCVGLSDASYFDWAEPLDGPLLTAMRGAARDLGSHLIVPFFERGELEGEYFNSVAVIDPDGELVPGVLPSGKSVTTYRKNAISAYHWDDHINDEKFYFRPGAGFPVFPTRFGRVGILICYDRWFPEAWRVLALQGAELVFVANASEGSAADMFVASVRTCAAQNLVYAIACNRAGVERIAGRETRYYGRSCIVDPRGRVLAQAGDGVAGEVIGAQLDLAQVAEARRHQAIYRDRRPELYQLLVGPGQPD